MSGFAPAEAKAYDTWMANVLDFEERAELTRRCAECENPLYDGHRAWKNIIAKARLCPECFAKMSKDEIAEWFGGKQLGENFDD